MAFPVVEETSSGNSGGNVSSQVVNLPSGSAGGDLIIIIIANDGSTTLSTSLEGWSSFGTGVNGSTVRITGFYKQLLTAESAITITVDSGSESLAWVAYRISGQYSGQAPEAATASTGTDTEPDPPNLDPAGWGTEDTLWIAAFACDSDSTTSAYPYTSNQATNQYGHSVHGCGVGACTTNSAASANNPGKFTISDTEEWVGQTIAVRPSSFTTHQGAATVAATGDVSSSAIIQKQGASTVAATGDVAGTATKTVEGAATVDGGAVVASSGIVITEGAATVDATGDVAASGVIEKQGAATVDATCDVVGDGTVIPGGTTHEGAATVAATGDVAAAGILEAQGAATVPAQGAVAASGILQAQGAATVAATGAVSAVGDVPAGGAVKTKVLASSTGMSTSKSFTSPGFGGVKAAIVFCSRATTYEADNDHCALSIGFWDGTNQACYSCFGEDGQGVGDTTQFGYNTAVIALDNPNSSLQFYGVCSNVTDGISIAFKNSSGNPVSPTGDYKVTVILLAGSQLQAKVGWHQTRNDTNDTDITSCGFQPNIVLMSTMYSLDGTHRSVYMYPCLGAAVDTGAGTTQRYYMQFQNQVTTMENFARLGVNGVSRKQNPAIYFWNLSVDSWDSSGFTIHQDQADSGQPYVMWLALDTGTAATWLGTISPRTSTGTWDSPNTGFKPQLVLGSFGTGDSVSTNMEGSNSDSWGVFAFDSAQAGSHLILEDDGANDSAAASYCSATVAYLADGSKTALHDIDFIAFDSTGWTATENITDSTTRYWWALAIEESVGVTQHEGAATVAATGAVAATGVLQAQGSATVAATGAVSATGVVEVYGAATVAAAGDVTAAGIQIAEASATVPAQGDVAATGVREAQGAAEVAGTCQIDAAGILVAQGASEVAGTCQIDAAGILQAQGAVEVSGTCDVVGDGVVEGMHEGAATVAATGDVAATGTLVAQGASTISGTCDIVADGVVEGMHEGAATVAGQMDVSAAGVVEVQAAATVAATGDVAATGVLIAEGAAVVDGTCDVVADGVVGGLQEGAATVPGQMDLTATGTRVVEAAATVACQMDLTASGTRRAEGSATIAATGDVTALATKTVEATATVDGSATVTATATKTVEASATLTGIMSLVAAWSAEWLPCECRVHRVPEETRIHTVAPETRIHRVPQQERIFRLTCRDLE